MKSGLKRIRIAGCPVDCYSMETAVAELCRRIDSSIRTNIIFVNASKVVQYHQNAALRDTIERADLLFADGVPIVWVSKLKGTPLPGRVAGIDLMERMVAMAAERGDRVFFLGSKPEIVEKTVRRLQERHPKLQVAGFHHGYFTLAQESEIVSQINQSRPDLLFIGMSTPQKEFWADRNLAKLNVSICQGVGGGFDVIAGLTKRAPGWMQRSGLEWFYRLLQEPGRMWKRYVVWNGSFVWLAGCDLLREFFSAVHTRAQSSPE
jgi:N-acetylglucosaminyldiphosphoundecaprenol N-acetyl-beta-D-mannosaminyltransferase